MQGAVVDAGLPAETLVVLDEGAGRDDLAMVAAVDHLVGVRQRDVGRRDAVFGEEAELLERPDPFGAVGQDRDAGVGVGDRGGLERPSLAIGQCLAAGHLDDAGAVLGPLDGRAEVVVRVDPVVDVGGEASRQLLRRLDLAPPVVGVVARQVEARRRDDVDAAPPADLGQLADVAPGARGHGVDDGAEPKRTCRPKLGDRLVDVGEQEVRIQLDRPAAVDDEVLVGVGRAEILRFDVAEDRADEGHAASSSRTLITTAAAPSTPAWSSSWAVRNSTVRPFGKMNAYSST